MQGNELKFIESSAYDELLIWFDFTGWKLNDFTNLISLTGIELPIEINEYSKETFICKDGNNNDFTMKIDYCYDKDSSTISIDFKDEIFALYEIPNKTSTYQNIENIFPIEITRKNCLNTKIETYKKTIKKIFTIGKIVYKISIICDNNDLFKKVISNSEDLDNHLLTMNFTEYSTMHFMHILLSKLNLSDDDLKNSDITVEIINIEENNVYSKTRLRKNVITEARFFTSTGFLDIFKRGKFVFTSKNKNISLVIKKLKDLEDEDFSEFLGFNKDFVLKLLDNMKSKKLLDISDIK